MTAYMNLGLSFVHFGIMLSCIECIHFGLIRPIEVVEEFGCHDTELRLTCGNLDSKLAILEATFTPNCTHEECLRFNMKRLVRTFDSDETEETKNAEKEAGKKFLDTLRNSHPKEKDVDKDILEDSDSITDEKSLSESINGQNKRRTSLRFVLERLIIRYLRRISPEDDLYAESFPRSRRNILLEASYVHSALNETEDNEDRREKEDSIRTKAARPHCDEQRRQISSLNRLDLEKSYMNQSDNEYNIRRVLNKRCSGKNHCSFIFTIDHPFAKVWDGGVVRVKYICMEDFRTNRYCGEHLPIGFEIDPKIQVLENSKGEPKAESRVQPRETSLHSLKIIKADGSIGHGNLRNLSMTLQESRKIKTNGSARRLDDVALGSHKNRVYSQDFRVLKILPSNIDDVNEVERIGDEIYFRNEESELNEQSSKDLKYETTIASDNDNFYENAKLKEEGVDHQLNNNSKIVDNITLTIREGGHYIHVYPSSSVPENLAASENILKYEVNGTMMTLVSTPTSDIRGEFEVETNLSLDITTQNSIKGDILSTSKQNYSEGLKEFHEGGLQKVDVVKLDQTQIAYNSIQKTSYRSPLLHGFAMTPGYPKFYIGDFECHWNIIAPEGIRVWITIIDISLRFDNICKDVLLIEDFAENKTLFNSCIEVIQPKAIFSTSNWIKITVRTTSKFAYPKRGVLLHYTADGCVNPPLPANVKLVGRTPTTAFYECQPSFLFPDSGLSTRILTCDKIHVWDKLLPDCIEQENFDRGEVTAEEKLTLISKKPVLSVITDRMSSQNDADIIFDIIIPSVLIAGLFIINGVVFTIIMKYRKRGKAVGDREMELAEL